MDADLPPTSFCVQTLLPQGLTILGGAPKVGKSWLVLDLCIRIAKGEPLWNLPTAQGTTLYLCLEDTLRRVQERLNCITDEVPSNVFFAVAAQSLLDGLCDQIADFTAEHPGTKLVAIDTFQMVRGRTDDVSYGNDYADIRQLKALADRLGLSILLVHHLRKQGDSDPLNKLSGSTGISGAADAVFVLDKGNRSDSGARLICTGRDVEHRELELRFDRNACRWELVADSLEQPELLLPKELAAFIAFMREVRFYTGTNSNLTDVLNQRNGFQLTPKGLKQLMNRWRQTLQDQGVTYENTRSNGTRYVEIHFSALESDASAGSDANNAASNFCDPCGTCGPAEDSMTGKEERE